ncbi:minor capsid protein [Capybara microvirus Cap3_SP_646]|nr:minor capsid protein [Capybara microvirus Cap3_SP_646]
MSWWTKIRDKVVDDVLGIDPNGGGIFNFFNDAFDKLGLDKIGDKIGGLFGDAWEDFTGKSDAVENNKAAMEAWNLMNDYNSPVKQMERLRAAGLNPNLVYGSGNVAGNTTSSPSLTGTNSNLFTGLSNVASVAGKALAMYQGYAGLDLTRAQTDQSKAAAANLGSQTAANNAGVAQTNANTELVKQNVEEKKVDVAIKRQQLQFAPMLYRAQANKMEADSVNSFLMNSINDIDYKQALVNLAESEANRKFNASFGGSAARGTVGSVASGLLDLLKWYFTPQRPSYRAYR